MHLRFGLGALPRANRLDQALPTEKPPPANTQRIPRHISHSANRRELRADLVPVGALRSFLRRTDAREPRGIMRYYSLIRDVQSYASLRRHGLRQRHDRFR